MPFRDRTGDPKWRRSRPGIERLEDRELLSFYGARHAVPRFAPPRPVAQLGPAVPASGGTVSANNIVGAPPPDLGAPTPKEAAKSHFVAKLSGSFETASGRYQKQPIQGELLTTGGSTQALRLQSQMQFFLYNDPNILPNGQINLSTKNVGNTGSALLLDLTGDPTSLVHGLPTRYTYTVNGGSGGFWLGATGTGTLDVHYVFSSRSQGIHSRGKAFVVINGTVVTSHGLTADIFLPGNRPKIG
jgi:hypothetical protein